MCKKRNTTHQSSFSEPQREADLNVPESCLPPFEVVDNRRSGLLLGRLLFDQGGAVGRKEIDYTRRLRARIDLIGLRDFRSCLASQVLNSQDRSEI